MSRFISAGVFLLLVARLASVRPEDDDDAAFVEVSAKNMKMLHTDEASGRSERSRIGNRAGIDSRPDPDGTPTKITAGVSLIHYYGMKLSEGTYTADIVLTFKWSDDRVGNLAGGSEVPVVTMTEDSAKQQLWLPEIGVINRNLNGLEQLSMSVTADKNKNSVLVERRCLAVLKSKFDISKFPFDSQMLDVVLSPTQYTDKEVLITMFEPGSEFASSIKDDAFTGSDVKWRAIADYKEDIAGANAMTKSRAGLQVTVHRRPDKFLIAIASPALCLLVMSYMVFWFPVLTPFVMPRLGASVISYMSLMQVSLKYDAMVAGAGYSWGDTYIQAVSTLMFITVVINIAMETIVHQLKAPEFASQMNNEMKYIFPVVSVLCLVLCTFIGSFGSLVGLVIAILYGHRCFSELVKLGVIKRGIPEDTLTDGKGQDDDESSDDKDSGKGLSEQKTYHP